MRIGAYGPQKQSELAPLMKAEDIKEPTKLTIKAAVVAKIKGEERPRLSFTETDKELIVNATNAQALAEKFGDVEVGELVGKQITIASVPTQYEGKATHGIRVV